MHRQVKVVAFKEFPIRKHREREIQLYKGEKANRIPFDISGFTKSFFSVRMKLLRNRLRKSIQGRKKEDEKIIELRILAKIRKSANGGCRCYASRWFDDQYWENDPND
ncbi:hypothetical protein [Enterococcus sp. AZ051]|uniref:hypothetical protein n=1 Tax=Enterococcus sp. AZ051 TaxID=2774698 RepID=UPI003D277480